MTDAATRIAQRLAGYSTPAYAPERDVRRVTRARLYGEPVGVGDELAMARHAAAQEAGTEKAADAGWEATGAPGVGRAAGEMYRDPSIANATDLGTRTAMMLLRPTTALKIMGAGYGAAAAKDVGGVGTSANAQARLTRSQQRQIELEKQKLEAEAKAKGETARLEGEARAREKQLTLEAEAASERQRVEREAAAKKAEDERLSYNAEVMSAENARKEEFGKQRRFTDTAVGKVYDKTGGYAPFLMGVGGGLVQRLAAGPGKTAVQKYALPAVEGSALTFAGLNAPLAYDALSAPTLNPKREGEIAYARGLPATHPRKADAMKYAESLPVENPEKKTAWDEFTSIPGLARRAVAAVAEGAPAGIFGANLPAAGAAALRGAGSVPGLIAEGRNVQRARTAEAGGAAAKAEIDAMAKSAKAQAAREASRGARTTADEALQLERASGVKGAGAVPPGSSPASRTSSVPAEAPQTIASPDPTRGQSPALVPPPGSQQQISQAVNGPQVVHHTLDDRALQAINEVADAMKNRAGAGGVRPSQREPGAGEWAARWSAPAREVVRERIAAGGNLAGGKGGLTQPGFSAAVGQKLPAGVSPPSRSEAGKRLGYLKSDVGEKPTIDQLDAYFKNVSPTRFAIPAAIGASGAALMSPDDAAAEDLRRRRGPAVTPPPGY